MSFIYGHDENAVPRYVLSSVPGLEFGYTRAEVLPTAVSSSDDLRPRSTPPDLNYDASARGFETHARSVSATRTRGRVCIEATSRTTKVGNVAAVVSRALGTPGRRDGG
eukprot:CAMPEP_0117643060 /NCGR_PEP_ID=MMETSP0802-20121206/10201_1 /TAXON_ID=38833 /ORGANISM="Micromonas sp., Strain CCMP2099" /LENGTH=108 /DNA_ID=CAMNT_0005448119 /DNA_START=15 /DNA_END=338 /DNA_ORIENTATION=-